MFQLLGSFSANRLGAKNVLFVSVLVWSVATFITPLLAESVPALIICRIVLGFAEGLGEYLYIILKIQVM